MPEEIKILDWTLLVDKMSTMIAYSKYKKYECDCTFCKNYLAATGFIPKEMRELFNKLGIDVSKPSEVYENCKNEDGTHLYGGFYHFTGTIISDSDEKYKTLIDSFQVYFHTRIALCPESFQKPKVQLEFVGNLPWVLNISPE